jgi:thiamine-monophosphate kinase
VSPEPAGPTVADVSEQDLIDRITTRLPIAPEWLVVGPGDDGAVVTPERNTLEVITTDACIEGVHFDRRFVPPGAIGHRALAVNLSDLAAMGAAPRLATLSLAMPGALPVPDFEAIVDGLLALARRHDTTVVGGNLSRSPGPLVVDVMAIGSVRPRRVLTRASARPGDIVFVSGTIGAARAGLAMCAVAPDAVAADAAGAAADGDAATPRGRYLRPTPRVRLGVLLGRNQAATSCMDLSDGLADGLRQLARASGTGMAVQGDTLPIDPAARAWFEAQGVDPVLEAAAGGDDYELLFTVSPRRERRLRAVARLARGLSVTRIGVVTRDRAIVLQRDGREEELPASFAHFGGRTVGRRTPGPGLPLAPGSGQP